jgi:lipopolysaccharide/colanic/teichoic acid biosynthesis glycosyltransferase
MGSSRPEDLTRSMMRNGSNMRSQIKLSDREKESETANLKKQKKFKRMTDIVKDFITLLKFAIVRFYQIDYNKLNLF